MKDSEQGSSEESDSEATVLPAGGSWEGKSPVDEAPDGDCIGTLYLDRQLDPGVRWVCLGKNRETGFYELLIPKGDWDNPDELYGFIDRVVNPTFVKSSLAQQNQG